METELRNLLNNIDKKFGKETIVGKVEEVERISTRSIGLDIASGGGYAKGRIIEIFGWESSGKTTLALHAVAEVQSSGGRVGYIDMEHSLDLFYAANLGCDVDIVSEDPKLIVTQPNCGEDALGIANEMVKSGKFDLVVVDSVAALIPKSLILGEVGDQKMGVVARLMSQWVPALAVAANKTGCTVIFINQLREKIGVMFGNPEVTSGGNALKFYASQRFDVSRCGQNKDGDEVISNKTRVKVIKNKTAPPFRKAEFNIVFGEGISKEAEVLDLASELNIVQKSGSWYSYGTTKLGQGQDSVIHLLKDNPELMEEIEIKLRNELGLPVINKKEDKKIKKSK